MKRPEDLSPEDRQAFLEEFWGILGEMLDKQILVADGLRERADELLDRSLRAETPYHGSSRENDESRRHLSASFRDRAAANAIYEMCARISRCERHAMGRVTRRGKEAT